MQTIRNACIVRALDVLTAQFLQKVAPNQRLFNGRGRTVTLGYQVSF
jgi:hypothetical protein